MGLPCKNALARTGQKLALAPSSAGPTRPLRNRITHKKQSITGKPPPQTTNYSEIGFFLAGSKDPE